MYASVKSVSKSQGVESKVRAHKNKGNKRGRGYYIQYIMDGNRVVKQIVHYIVGKYTWKIGRKKRRLNRCMK